MNIATKLAELMDVWPETTVAYAQDSNGMIFPFTDVPKWGGDEWDGALDFDLDAYVYDAELFTGYMAEIVTKEDWEAARVAK